MNRLKGNKNRIQPNSAKAMLSAVLLAGIVAAAVFTVFAASGCSGDSQNTGNSSETTSFEDKEGAYVSPEFRDAEINWDQAESDGTVFYIDTSSVARGYVAAAGTTDTKLKFEVNFGDVSYIYDLKTDGTPCIYPLQSGDGTYSFCIMNNIVDSSYAIVLKAETDVTMDSEFEPYLRPNIYANYSQDSECVKKAAEFASHADTALEIITQVYDYVCENVTYDYEKVDNIETTYLPVPDDTFSTGKGICMDYAALTAAMLRSQGIPTKVIFGYVSPGDNYHAWNMFYTEETGWVTVEFKANEKDWTRIDLTFSANGADETFIGDGSNYADLKQF